MVLVWVGSWRPLETKEGMSVVVEAGEAGQSLDQGLLHQGPDRGPLARSFHSTKNCHLLSEGREGRVRLYRLERRGE